MADAKDLSKGPQIASSGAPIKEAHANKKKDKDGNEIRLEELATFNPETFLESHRSFLKKLHIIALIFMIIAGIMLIFAITLCITFSILSASEIKSIEELQLTEKSTNLEKWKLSSCKTCFLSNENGTDSITTNMFRNLAKDSKEIETTLCEYSKSNLWECNGIKFNEQNISQSDFNKNYFCLRN
uniref:Uncharacterized protein n=1 Tax=Panagrolaimus sp. PS1159 TaxID=55785 RepID=A0AC35G146_9BILA